MSASWGSEVCDREVGRSSMYGAVMTAGLDLVDDAEAMVACRGGVGWQDKGVGSTHGSADGLGAMVAGSAEVRRGAGDGSGSTTVGELENVSECLRVAA
jgi:hypothetical protein